VTDAAKKLLTQVLALPEEDQRWIADRLLDHVPRDADEIERAWADEAVERLERAERGEAKLVSYDDVRERVQGMLRRK
jgi:hypothetical protein